MTKLEKLRDELAENIPGSWYEYQYTSDRVYAHGFDAMLAEHEKLVKPLIEALEYYANAMAFGYDKRDGNLFEMKRVFAAHVVKEPTLMEPPNKFGHSAKQALEAYRKAVE